MKPQVVATALGERLAPDAIITGDSGANTTWLARHLQVQRGQQVSGSGTLASMASALPYAIAAQIAYPERQVVATVGDGGFSQLMAEFATAVHEQLPIKVILFKNDLLAQIKWEQLVFLGNPEYGVTLQPIDFVKIAEACGGTGLRVEDPALVGETLDRALALPGPVLVEAVIDPFEPPMPARVKTEQAVNMAKALAKGEPNRERIAATIFRTKTADLLATTSDDGPLAAVKEKLREAVRGDE
jgi:pyruvate dehydrogenase (quinone)/pyruvate oxidase